MRIFGIEIGLPRLLREERDALRKERSKAQLEAFNARAAFIDELAMSFLNDLKKRPKAK